MAQAQSERFGRAIRSRFRITSAEVHAAQGLRAAPAQLCASRAFLGLAFYRFGAGGYAQRRGPLTLALAPGLRGPVRDRTADLKRNQPECARASRTRSWSRREARSFISLGSRVGALHAAWRKHVGHRGRPGARGIHSWASGAPGAGRIPVGPLEIPGRLRDRREHPGGGARSRGPAAGPACHRSQWPRTKISSRAATL